MASGYTPPAPAGVKKLALLTDITFAGLSGLRLLQAVGATPAAGFLFGKDKLANLSDMPTTGIGAGKLLKALGGLLGAGFGWLSLPSVVTREYATKVVAANNSNGPGKAGADYVCSGINDHIIINLAINAVLAIGGMVVLLEGTYNTPGTIAVKSNVTLMGNGAGTVIRNTSTISLGILVSLAIRTKARISNLTIQNLQNGLKRRHLRITLSSLCLIDNVWFIGTSGANPVYPVLVINSQLVVFAHCFVSSGWANDNGTIVFKGGIGNSVVGCSFLSPQWCIGLMGGNAGMLGSAADSVTIADCVMRRNSGLGALGGVYMGKATRCIISGLTFYGTSGGSLSVGVLALGANQCIIADSTFAGAHGINLLRGADNIVASCQFIGNNPTQGIKLGNGGVNNLIIGCSFLGSGSGSGTLAGQIVFNSGASSNFVTGCSLRANGTTKYGFVVKSGANNNLITNNDDRTSGTTATLSDAGSGTIYSLAGSPAPSPANTLSSLRFGIGASNGLGTTYSRANHAHGTPNPLLYDGICSADFSPTTIQADITGATTTFTTSRTNVRCLVAATFDVLDLSVGSGAITGRVLIDGVQTGPQVVVSDLVGRSQRTLVFFATLATAASHTLKLQAAKTNLLGTVTIKATNTRIEVLAFD